MKPVLRAGARLGRYRLVERIALGGMAEVWSAFDEEEPERPLALKVMRPSWVEREDHLDMFEDEVALGRRLRHENVVEVYRGEKIDGHLVQVMELLEGTDLRRVLTRLEKRGWRFPIPLVAYVARSMARGLWHAHEKRGPGGQILHIVHRDISPHNVFLTAEGKVKVLDFGIAKAVDRQHRTRGQIIKGKTSYMAPEQTVGGRLDHRVDIFASGIVLWEMLALERLFRAPTDTATMEKVLEAKVPRLEGLRTDVPTELADLVHKMLERRPEDRPATMLEVERALQRLLHRRYEPDETGPEALAAWLARVREGEARKRTARLAPLPVQPAPKDAFDDHTELDPGPNPDG